MHIIEEAIKIERLAFVGLQLIEPSQRTMRSLKERFLKRCRRIYGFYNWHRNS
jgi:hypothetical protein